MADIGTVTVTISNNPHGYDMKLIAAAVQARIDRRDPRPVYQEIVGYDPYNHHGSSAGRRK